MKIEVGKMSRKIAQRQGRYIGTGWASQLIKLSSNDSSIYRPDLCSELVSNPCHTCCKPEVSLFAFKANIWNLAKALEQAHLLKGHSVLCWPASCSFSIMELHYW